MNDHDRTLDHLAARARRAAAGSDEMPFGLDTRVLAGLRAARGTFAGSLWARFALRALPCAAAVFALMLVARHFAPPPAPPTETQMADALFQQLLQP